MTPETALKRVNAALFPPPRTDRDGDKVSDDAYYNLAGALIDLKRTGADKICIRTIERVLKQIAKAARVLDQAGLK